MFEHLPEFQPFLLQNFDIETFKIKSRILASNALKDPSERLIPVLVPKTKQQELPVVFILAGFTGNAPFYLNQKFAEKNAAQVLDEAVTDRKAPEALYVFVDAMTTWGGSQFINSAAIGHYEDFLIQEVLPAIQITYSSSQNPQLRALVGGSSGGYGALHLGSKYPQLFGAVGAIAPDSFFEASLLTELYLALPVWEKYQCQSANILAALRQGQLKKNKNFHSLLNAFAMCACYLPTGSGVEFHFPLDPKTGLKINHLWSQLLNQDPVHFLKDRDFYRTQSKVYLDVGNKDQYHLHYGARQIHRQMQEAGFAHSYSEFDGNHFDIGERRPQLWQWLQELWT